MTDWLKKMATPVVILMLLLLCLSACAVPPQKPAQPDLKYLENYLSWYAHREMKKSNVTGLSIALVDARGMIWANGFGFADKLGKRLATPETLYRVGSVSELITASAAMKLVESRRFDLDHDLTRYLPEFSVKRLEHAAMPITLRSLMTHHSGLPSDVLKGMWSSHPQPLSSVLSLIRDEYQAYPTDYVLSYSNVGISLLGLAIERSSGQDFPDFVRDSLLAPLGMEHSYFSPFIDTSLLSSKAYQEGEEATEVPTRSVPASGLNSSVLDLGRFAQMVLARGRLGEEAILRPESVSEMLRPQNMNVPLDLNFHVGLGWILGGLGNINIQGAGLVAHHSGTTIHHCSQLILLPDQNLGVVVLANSSSATPAVNNLATEALKLALEWKRGIVQPSRQSAPEKKYPENRADLKVWEGRYATIAGLVKIKSAGNHLKVDVAGKTLRLVPKSAGMLGLEYRMLGFVSVDLGDISDIRFSRERIAGHSIIKASSGGQELLIGKQLDRVVIGEQWRERIGSYQIINPGADVLKVEDLCLEIEGGLLIMDYAIPLSGQNRIRVALMPLSSSLARIRGLGRGMGEVIQIVDRGGEEILRYSGYLFRRVQPETMR